MSDDIKRIKFAVERILKRRIAGATYTSDKLIEDPDLYFSDVVVLVDKIKQYEEEEE